MVSNRPSTAELRGDKPSLRAAGSVAQHRPTTFTFDAALARAIRLAARGSNVSWLLNDLLTAWHAATPEPQYGPPTGARVKRGARGVPREDCSVALDRGVLARIRREAEHREITISELAARALRPHFPATGDPDAHE